jgi:hypothetical protein
LGLKGLVVVVVVVVVVFPWMLLMDRLNVRNILRRKKNINFKATIIAVSYVLPFVRKQLSTCSSLAPLVRPDGIIWEFTGGLTLAFMQ